MIGGRGAVEGSGKDDEKAGALFPVLAVNASGGDDCAAEERRARD